MRKTQFTIIAKINRRHFLHIIFINYMINGITKTALLRYFHIIGLKIKNYN